MAFQIAALAVDQFDELFALSDTALQERGMKRYVADRTPGFPCRVSLQDAIPGERVILVSYPHQPAESPYKASGPIFVREDATQAAPDPGEVPGLLRLRTLSVRGYSSRANIVDAMLVKGLESESAVDKLFANPHIDYLHVHYADAGCYACRVDRVKA